jgi:demethylspheroidene O-methyltransferase
LFDVCAGFVYSQILFACVRLKLFDALAEGPLGAAELATRLQVPLDSTERLLEAAVSLQLVDRRPGDRFGLGSLGAALVGNPAVGAMVEHHRLLYADLYDPVGLLRGELHETELGKYWKYAKGNTSPRRSLEGTESAAADAAGSSAAPGTAASGGTASGGTATAPGERVDDYSALMSNSQSLVSAEILDAYSLAKHQWLLDVGGGEGGFLIEAGKRHKHLKLQLFDLPDVAQRARARFASLDLEPRVEARGGNFLTEPLPVGADVISLVRVVHDHDDDAVMALLHAAHRALPASGTLLLAEPMMGTPGAEPVGDAYFGFYLLAMGQGRPRTPQTLHRMLRTAGFDSSHLVGTHQPLQTRLIVARKSRHEKSVKLN